MRPYAGRTFIAASCLFLLMALTARTIHDRTVTLEQLIVSAPIAGLLITSLMAAHAEWSGRASSHNKGVS